VKTETVKFIPKCGRE